MKILMAVDDSRFYGDALKAVMTQFRTEDTEVLVLHVLQPVGPAPPQMDASYAPELAKEKQAAQVLIDKVATELRHAGFKVETRIEIGDVREGIVDCAAQWGADLILVGSHGEGTIQRFLLGSVSDSVARNAKCSVQIIRTQAAACAVA